MGSVDAWRDRRWLRGVCLCDVGRMLSGEGGWTRKESLDLSADPAGVKLLVSNGVDLYLVTLSDELYNGRDVVGWTYHGPFPGIPVEKDSWSAVKQRFRD